MLSNIAALFATWLALRDGDSMLTIASTSLSTWGSID
jgi:hypothetical protein